MAISFRNSMNCHLHIKGICIILIEYFYYYIHSRTADSEKYAEKGRARGATYYSHSSEENRFSQYIFKRNKICMRNTCRYTSDWPRMSKERRITTEQWALSDLALLKEWRIFIAFVSACVLTITFIVLENGVPFALLCEVTCTSSQRKLTLLGETVGV